MVRETQQLLPKDDPPEEHDEDHVLPVLHQHTEECYKKHGIFCRIMTALHLKKRKTDRQKLLSESQEHLPDQPDGHIDSDEVKKQKSKKAAKGSEARSKSTKEPKAGKSGSFSANSNSNNNRFATTYEMLDNESQSSECDIPLLFEPPARITVKEDPRSFVEPISITNVHIYSDDHFGERYICRPDDKPLIEIPRTDTQTTGHYIRHQWHGKRAKKARKRFRRVMRSTWLALQSATSTTVIPSAQTVVTAVSSTTRK